MKGEDKTAADGGGVVVELPLGGAAENFNLEKAVCSHGLFMMAPNHWDPHSKTLRRPLRLNLNDDEDDETSVIVHISHPPHSAHALHLRVFGTHSLSSQQQQSLLSQVRRMLRLSDEESRRVIEFHKVHEEARGLGFGRVFRSPTLFEDMIKCILLCNCQWSRTLSMAQALCELQAELQQPFSNPSNLMAETENKNFVPKTPSGKESKKKSRVHKQTITKSNKYTYNSAVEEDTEVKITIVENSCQTSDSVPNLDTMEGEERFAGPKIGNFPSPKELASLDEKFLARRCSLGYRASRVINLAREVFEGRIQLRELEYGLFDYGELAEKLKAIDGFGPFTCANVLMCMGFYHVIPTDSETIRHLKQVHAKISTIRTVQGDVEEIYGKYAPFQFLAYWSEVWNFYEEWFGKLSEMPHSNYRLITASNMRPTKKASKRKLSMEDVS